MLGPGPARGDEFGDGRRASSVEALLHGPHGIGWASRPRSVLLTVAAALFCDYALLTVIIPLVPHYQRGLGVSGVSVGLLFACKGIAQLLANPLWGRAADRLGPPRPFVAGVAILSASTALYAFASAARPSYALLVVARSIQGVGSAAIMSAGMAWISSVFAGGSDGSRGEAMGSAMSGVGLGVMSGPALGGLAFVGTPLGEALPFAALALVLVALMPVLAAVMRARSRRRGGVQRADADGEPAPEHLGTVLRDTRVALLVAALAVADSGIAVVEPIVPARLESKFGISAGLTGVVFLAVTLAYSVASPLIGRLGANWNRPATAAGGMLLMAGSLALLGVAPKLWMFVACLAALGTGMGAVDSSVFPQLADVVEGTFPGSFGAVFSLADIALSLGYVVGPLAGTALEHHTSFFTATGGYGLLLVLAAPLAALAGRAKLQAGGPAPAHRRMSSLPMDDHSPPGGGGNASTGAGGARAGDYEAL